MNTMLNVITGDPFASSLTLRCLCGFVWKNNQGNLHVSYIKPSGIFLRTKQCWKLELKSSFNKKTSLKTEAAWSCKTPCQGTQGTHSREIDTAMFACFYYTEYSADPHRIYITRRGFSPRTKLYRKLESKSWFNKKLSLKTEPDWSCTVPCQSSGGTHFQGKWHPVFV